MSEPNLHFTSKKMLDGRLDKIVFNSNSANGFDYYMEVLAYVDDILQRIDQISDIVMTYGFM